MIPSLIENYFVSTFSALDESQLCIYMGGEKVVDTSHGIDPDSLIPVFSVSKAISALVVAHVVDNFDLKIDECVSHYWPEFAQHGKAEITVRQLLSHQAGLPETKARLTNAQYLLPREAAQLLAQEKPFWKPGSAFGYHARTIGVFMNEIVTRVTGFSIQQYFERNLREGSDVFLGAPLEVHGRVADPLPAIDPLPQSPETSLAHQVFNSFYSTLDMENEYSITSQRSLEFGDPAIGAVASARGLAQLFNSVTDYGASKGKISSATLEDFAHTQILGHDLVLDFPVASFGTIFMKPTSAKPFGSSQAFGHDGAAGALVFIDPSNEIVFAYTRRRFPSVGGFDSRFLPILESLRKGPIKDRSSDGNMQPGHLRDRDPFQTSL